VPQVKALGIEWVETGSSRPESGVEIKNMALAQALFELQHEGRHATHGLTAHGRAAAASAAIPKDNRDATTEPGQVKKVGCLAKALSMFDEGMDAQGSGDDKRASEMPTSSRNMHSHEDRPDSKPRRVVNLSEAWQILKKCGLDKYVQEEMAGRIFVETVAQASVSRGTNNRKREGVLSMNKSMYHSYIHAIANTLDVLQELLEHERMERKTMVLSLVKAIGLFDEYSKAEARGGNRRGVGEGKEEEGEMKSSSREQEERRREVLQILKDAGLEEQVVEAVASEEVAKLEAKVHDKDDRRVSATPSSSSSRNLYSRAAGPAGKSRRVVGLSEAWQILKKCGLNKYVLEEMANRIFFEVVTQKQEHVDRHQMQTPVSRGTEVKRSGEALDKSMHHSYLYAIAKSLGVLQELVEHERMVRKAKVLHLVPELVRALGLFDDYSKTEASFANRRGAGEKTEKEESRRRSSEMRSGSRDPHPGLLTHGSRKVSLLEVQQILKDVRLDGHFEEALISKVYAKVIADELKMRFLLLNTQAPMSWGTNKQKNDELLDKSMYHSCIHALAKILGLHHELLARESTMGETFQDEAMQYNRVSFTQEELNRIFLPELRRDSYAKAFGASNRYYKPDPAGVVGHWPLAKEAKWQVLMELSKAIIYILKIVYYFHLILKQIMEI
jgi:hypothetical protein